MSSAVFLSSVHPARIPDRYRRGMVNHTCQPSRSPADRLNSPADGAPIDAPLLADIHRVAAILSCSTRHVEDMNREARIPVPRRLGRLLRWDVAELREWVSAGCPDRPTWEQRKKTGDPASPSGAAT